MKKKTIKVDIVDKENIIKQYNSFYYVLENEIVDGDKIYLTFSRDLTNHKRKNEILQLEDEFNSFKIPSFIPIIVLSILSFLLLTALLICIFVFKDSPDKNIYVFSLGIPSALCVCLMSGYYYFRTSRMNRNITTFNTEKEKIFKKLEEIKNEDER